MKKLLKPTTKLSKNFRLIEFTHSESASLTIQVENGGHSEWLLKNITKKIMQPLRDDLGPIRISNGIRNQAIWDVLKSDGYYPSKTTDHSYGDCELNRHGVGACDFLLKGMRNDYEENEWSGLMWEAYRTIRKFMDYGQVIMYVEAKGSGATPRFIHVSNPPQLVHSVPMIEHLGRWKNKSLIKVGRNSGGYFPWTENLEKKLREG